MIQDRVNDAAKFLTILSWRKLTQLVVFLFIVGLSWATFENRETIYGFANQKRLDPTTPAITKLSKISIDAMHAVVYRSELILGIRVYIADFQKNTRVLVHQESDDASLDDVYSRYYNTSINDLPLFTADASANKLLVSLINGEFVCVPFTDSLLSKYAPNVINYVQFVCSNGIPASYGRFTGIIQVDLKRDPKPEEIDQIRSTIRTLSTTVYEEDLSRIRKK